MGAGVDINQNQMSDYQDALAQIQKQQNYTDTMSFKREQEVNKNRTEAEKLNIERERMNVQKEIADKQLQIARENKNKYDVKEKPTKK
jgi:multidrug efflux pump subunit AcrA (membrane-fusion protein)